MNIKKIENVLKQSAQDRYGYLIRKVADFQTIFTICDRSGGLITIGDNKVKCIPFWPEKEFAELHLTHGWSNYKVKAFNLNDFLTWLNKLQSDNYSIAGFPNGKLNAVVVSPDEIKNHLIYECRKYE
ncbi:DUF2750 domain-containing protein [Psychroserpens mesophilus]|uniref:DUF2750 domain-containing protein n=1 Tax=Psychroserpens mesophilus TaxID=325473 RepID=UPI00058D9B82|nr:DUF2750 domain-containing protein [Psychroserpens mesophilus]